jgi:hypothetical protein
MVHPCLCISELFLIKSTWCRNILALSYVEARVSKREEMAVLAWSIDSLFSPREKTPSWCRFNWRGSFSQLSESYDLSQDFL